jgi:hypothetical protein
VTIRLSSHATRRATVARQLRDLVKALSRISGLHSVREWIGWSQVQMGIHLGLHRFNGTGAVSAPFHKSTIGHVENGDYTIPHQRKLYQAVLDEAVRGESGNRLTVRLDRQSRVIVYRLYDCGHTARYERSNFTRCPKCRGLSARPPDRQLLRAVRGAHRNRS